MARSQPHDGGAEVLHHLIARPHDCPQTTDDATSSRSRESAHAPMTQTARIRARLDVVRVSLAGLLLIGCRPDFDFSRLPAETSQLVDSVQICRISALYRERPWRVTVGTVQDRQALPGARHHWATLCGNHPIMLNFPDPGEVGRPPYFDLHPGMRVRVRITALTFNADGYGGQGWLVGRVPVVRYEGID